MFKLVRFVLYMLGMIVRLARTVVSGMVNFIFRMFKLFSYGLSLVFLISVYRAWIARQQFADELSTNQEKAVGDTITTVP